MKAKEASIKSKAILLSILVVFLTFVVANKVSNQLKSKLKEKKSLENLLSDDDIDQNALQKARYDLLNLTSSVITTSKSSYELKEDIVTLIVSMQDTLNINVHEVPETQIYFEQGFEVITNRVILSGSLIGLMHVQAELERSDKDFNVLSAKYFHGNHKDEKEKLFTEIYLESYRKLD